LPVLSRARASARNVACISTVRQLAAALHLYAADNATCLPDPARGNQSWEQMIRKYHRGGTFVCEADNELARAVGSSYDWRDTGHPSTTLAGRRVPDVRRQNAVMVFEAMPGWHHARRVNVARIDCSAATMLDDQCLIDLSQPIVTP
jgi:hypothetical protein